MSQDWLVQAIGGRPPTPQEEFAELEAERAAAVEHVQAVDGKLDELVERRRAARHEEEAQGGAMLRASAGVRQPVTKRPTPSAQMNVWLAQSLGLRR